MEHKILSKVFTYVLVTSGLELYLEPTGTSTTELFARKSCIKLREENAGKLSDWFSNNYFKESPDKFHLLSNRTDNIRINVRNETISNSSNQNLLGIYFNSNLINADQ